MSTAADIEPRRLTPRQRRIRRNLALGVLATAATISIVAALPIEALEHRVSMATAYVSLALLVACLAVGPLNVLRGRPNPVSTHLRRDLGIWGGAIALGHVVVGLTVHMKHFWYYFIYEPERRQGFPVRHDLFGFANFTGLASAIILVVLLAISNDAALRRLGTDRWKRWQRWNYVATALFVAHTVAFQVIEDRVLPIVLLCAAALLFALATQLAGVRHVRQGD